ncbi:hypothetical protein LCGC14_2163800, partial [marine sediment metagenome]
MWTVVLTALSSSSPAVGVTRNKYRVNLQGIGPKNSVVIYQDNVTLVLSLNNGAVSKLTVRGGTPTS